MLSTAATIRASVIGQDHVINEIDPFITVYQAGLAPANRPIGVFMLAGPTGTGKTKTVEAVAEALHGSERNVLRIDCGEFQHGHEVARLIGAPPGYLGHRETQPLLSQSRINATMSDRNTIGVVLFDEIEKADAALYRILLGVCDRGNLRLGDNQLVNLDRCLIFMTTNLGAKSGDCEGAIRDHFSPEFVNRLDRVLAFRPLGLADFERIIDLEISKVQSLVTQRLGDRGFEIRVSRVAKDWLIDKSIDPRSGAREMKRVIFRHLIVPLAEAIKSGNAGGVVSFESRQDDALTPCFSRGAA